MNKWANKNQRAKFYKLIDNQDDIKMRLDVNILAIFNREKCK